MGAFFRTAIGDHLLNDAPAILDWLFDDKKFNNKHWTMGTKRKLTNRISKLDGFSPSAFAKKAGGNEYPKIQSVLSIVLRTFNLPSVRQLFLAATRRGTGGSSIPCSRRT